MFDIINNTLVKYINEDNITDVIIPDNVTSIGEYAFAWCSNLTSINIPDSVKSIGSYAFCNCKNLTNIVIPGSITKISRGVFYGCENLINIVIPDNITSIGDCAFYDCENLINIVISDNITSIGDYAFCGCKNLISKKANYKAFNITKYGLECMNYIFEPNKWAKNVQNPTICERGYHFCDNLFNIFNYYDGEIDKDIAIYECEIGDIVFFDEDNAKYVTNRIKPIKRLNRKNVIDILNNMQKEENYVYNESKS